MLAQREAQPAPSLLRHAATMSTQLQADRPDPHPPGCGRRAFAACIALGAWPAVAMPREGVHALREARSTFEALAATAR
jgi:hypothetical protein